MADKEAAVVILDVGKSTNILVDSSLSSVKDGGGGNYNGTFFEKAKKCVEKIFQRKIFSRPKDEIGLVLMGTDGTNNMLHDTLGGYENISCAFDIEITKWEMLQIIEKEIQPSQNGNEGDWLDALIVAMDILRNQTIGKKIKTYKIVLLTPFLQPVDDDNVPVVISGLNSMNIELIVISHNVQYVTTATGNIQKDVEDKDTDDDDFDFDNEDPVFSQIPGKSQGQKSSERLIQHILEETEGALCNFDKAILQLIYFERKTKKSMPWNCDLEIGSKLKIKIAAYLCIKEETDLGAWKTESENAPCKMTTEYFHDDEKIEIDDADDVMEKFIKGYMYGSTAVAYDESVGISNSTLNVKSFKCIGFVEMQYLQTEHFVGDAVWSIVTQKNCLSSEKILTAMVNIMKKLNLAMILRYCYRNGTKPKLMAIFPSTIDNIILTSETLCGKIRSHLQMLELYYGENHIFVKLPKLRSKGQQPSNEQYHAIDRLIDSMNLMNALNVNDDIKSDNEKQKIATEAFSVRKIMNPTLQYMYRTIAHRALNPNQPLLVPDKDLLDVLEPPKKLQELSASAVTDIQKLFPLEITKKGAKELLFAKLQQIPEQPSSTIDDNLLTSSADAGANNGLLIGNDDDPTNDSGKNLTEIGTVTPAEDFAILLDRGERFATLCLQIQNVISDLVFKTVVISNVKVARAIMIYREEAKLLGPFRYNEWIKEFKSMLLKRNKIEFWENVIVKENFGLIGFKDSEMSTITEEEMNEFYQINLGAGTTSTSGGNEGDDDDDGDVNDLLDRM